MTKRLIIILFLFLAGVLLSSNFYSLSKQNDPIHLGIALLELKLSDIPMVKINDEEYLLRKNTAYVPFIQAMKDKGWYLKKRLGDRLVFTSQSNEVTAVGKSFKGDFKLVYLQTTDESSLPRKGTITITAAGDILMHNTQISSGLQSDGSYNFDNFFQPVKKLLEEGDYCSTNLEAALAGPASGYSGYPMFNSPDAIASTLKHAGFDLVVTANNHCLDRSYQGALRTIQVLRNAGLDTTGTYSAAEERSHFLIKEIQGIKVGYLAYTYGTNGIPIPQQHPYLVNLLDRQKVVEDIKQLRPEVDVLVLVLHWGTEYSPQASGEQKKLAGAFFAAGVDVILGSHPHVIEPMEVVKVGKKDKLVIYSMGNFISHQRGMERNSGVILKLKFTKDFDKGETTLQEVTYTPTFSHPYYIQGRQQFRVVPVEETIKKILDGKDPYLSIVDLPVLKQVLATTHKQLGQPFFAASK